MKAVLFIVVVFVLFISNSIQAAEQKIIFSLETVSSKRNLNHVCQQVCTNPSLSTLKSENVEEMLNKGWRIVTSQPKEVPELDGTCSCNGTQYVLQKDDPEDVKSDLSSQKEQLLVKENALLKQQVDLLKQENGSLKAQLTIKHK